MVFPQLLLRSCSAAHMRGYSQLFVFPFVLERKNGRFKEGCTAQSIPAEISPSHRELYPHMESGGEASMPGWVMANH